MKPYPCCRHTHPAIDAALEIRDSLGGGPGGDLTADHIASVRILTYPAALDVTNRPRPTTPYAAKFSMQYCVARSLASGPPDLTSFEPNELTSDVLREWMRKTTVEVDPRYEAAYPSHWGAEVVTTGVDGTLHRASRKDAVGDPERPLDNSALNQKVLGLLDYGGVEGPTASDLLKECQALAEAAQVFSLPPLDAVES